MGLDDFVPDSLVRSFMVIMAYIFLDCTAQGGFSKEDHFVETLVLDRFDKAFGVAVHHGHVLWQFEGDRATVSQELTEFLVKERVAVVQHPFLSNEKAVERIGQITSDL